MSFPRVQGLYQMTRNWSVTLPDEFARRFEESEFGSDLVLWRPGITCWTSAHNYREGDTPESVYKLWRSDCNPEAKLVFEFPETMPIRFAYLLHEETDEDTRWGLYTYRFGNSGWVMMAIYHDELADLDLVKEIWSSIKETPENP